MGISSLLIFVIDISLDKDVAGAFKILCWNIFGIHDTQSDLVVKKWFWCNVPNFLLPLYLLVLCFWFNLKPAFNNALGERGAVVIELSILNRFLVECLPVTTEEPVVQVNVCLTDKIVTKDWIIVPYFNFQRRSTWEVSRKGEDLVYLWIWFINLMLVAIICFAIPMSDKNVWVTKGTNISRCKVIAVQNVKLDCCTSLR